MTEISSQELKSRIDSGEKLNLLDVREEWEYQEFNIGAKNIPLSVFMSKLDELQDWKNEEVIVHCKMGGRTMQAAAILEQAGFKNVVVYIGGMDEWIATFVNPPTQAHQ
ncbi:MAG TPA: rhodanese-like domain-containing protein [Chitinophagales bacterium]|nr:rhodanese-like domain-containing protein [Chitinophagales bacterium]